MKNLTWQNPEQLFVAQEHINKVKSKCCGIKDYIEVKPDFSDLEEKMDYYTAHPDEAQAIINHAHEYVEQFKDKQREDIISLMVLDKYFSLLKSKD